jgi:hypothetical protein
MAVDPRCLKDNDLRERLHVSPQQASSTIVRLWRDADFLCSLGEQHVRVQQQHSSICRVFAFGWA